MLQKSVCTKNSSEDSEIATESEQSAPRSNLRNRFSAPSTPYERAEDPRKRASAAVRMDRQAGEESAEHLRGKADGAEAGNVWLGSGRPSSDLLLAARELAAVRQSTTRLEYEAGYGAGLAERLQAGLDEARAARLAAGSEPVAEVA